jgi:anti-anti-sigma factor
MPLDVAIADHGIERRRVTLTGRLDTETTPLLEACLAPVLAAPAVTALVFDLAALEYISSAGIRALVKARKALEGRGGRVMVAHVQPAVRKVFDIVRALPAASIFASDTELDAYLDAMQRRVRRDP